jgi:hypothetical protein
MNAPRKQIQSAYGVKPAPAKPHLPQTVFAPPQNTCRVESESLFQEAKVTLSAIKAGFFGEQGSGKTTSAFLLALGLSKTFHNGAPIFMHDTEAGSDFLVSLAAIEGVKLLVRKSRSFREMCAGLHQAAREGACVYMEDSITSDWNDLMESFKRDKKIHKIEIYHWGEIKPKWNDEWVVPMLNSPCHVITCGREGDKWDDVVQEDGSTKATRVGIKMKAEGEFGYEPFLLVNMHAEQKLQGRKRLGTFAHTATILKDKSRTIQGLEFEWPDINRYKKGDWEKVFDKFAPHIKFFNIGNGQQHEAIVDTRGEVVFNGDGNSDWYKRKQEREIFVEEIEGLLLAFWPGQDAKSKKFKLDSLEALFKTRSWKKVETLTATELEIGLARLRNMRVKTTGTPLDDEETVAATLREAAEFNPVAEIKA